VLLACRFLVLWSVALMAWCASERSLSATLRSFSDRWYSETFEFSQSFFEYRDTRDFLQ
jgi:hypothetical protein